LGKAVALSDLLRQTFIVTRDLDTNDIRSRELSMIHVSKAMALHLLLGNLATNGVTNGNNDANAVDPSAFLPQRNLSLVKEQRSKDQNSCTKVGMDVLDSHKTKTATGIICIGSITNMRDITSLCINICAVISAITSDSSPEPVLRTIMTTISQLTLNRDWDDWIKACGSQMPHLHFHIFSFIDRIWDLLATGATKFSNINVVSGNRPIGDLNLTHHRKAIRVLWALVNQITLHQSQGTPIMVQASVTTKYCPMLASSAHLPKPATPGANTSNSANHRDSKRNSATRMEETEKNTNKESNKKVWVVNKTRGVHKKRLACSI
jgi:hypothetical protein